MTAIPEKPVPVPGALSQTYWDGLAAGELRLQYCAACGTPRHYPRLLCDRCYHAEVEWKPASGCGRIHSWTVAHHAFHPGFAAELPYTLVTVDLDEGPRALGRWRGGELALGRAVVARFETFENGVGLVFEPGGH
ncbi:MAG: Zn-ribbon domain-containing OB-fold protein [Gammaproteobacteria bacterium]|jgi:uncharacterized OB-fold protein